MDGQQPADLSVTRLLRDEILINWSERVRLFAGGRRGITASRKAEDFAFLMDEINRSPFDYFLVSLIDVGTGRLRLAEENGLALDSYRFESLDPLYALVEGTSLRVYGR